MKNFIRNSFILMHFLFLLPFISCTNYPSFREPDLNMFTNQAAKSTLIDSLKNGELTDGMPYYVVSEVFSDWPENLKKIKVPVASLGSKQQLQEVEGWGRVYVDPDNHVFMDEYKTKNGVLNVWYQLPNFYRMDISSGDTLVIILPDTVLSSVISGLRNRNVLTISDPFNNIPNSHDLYAEVHYKDHPWREKTYWYTLRVLSDGKNFMLKDLQYQIYPIELLEFNNQPVGSFNWRKN